MSHVQEELFQLALSGIIWQGKSHNTMLTESCIFQNICSFGDDMWAAVHELCLHSWQGLPEHLHCCRARGRENADAHSSLWAVWEAVSLNPFGSLAHFLWPLIHTHLTAHTGDWYLLPNCTRCECPGTTMEVSSSSLPRSVVLLALVYDFGNLPPWGKKEKSFLKSNIIPHIYREPASSKGKSKILLHLEPFFSVHFSDLKGELHFSRVCIL